MRIVYLNGKFLPIEQAKVSVLDRGFLFADGVYEVVPVYENHAFRLEQHLERLRTSMAGISLSLSTSNAELTEIIHQLLTKNQAINGNSQMVYLQVTRGAAPERYHAWTTNLEPTVFIQATPLPKMDEAVLQKGLKAITLPDVRWENCHIKSIMLLANVLMFQQAKQEDAQEAILLRNGLVIEGATSNVFIVKNGIIKTPPKCNHLLGGITRDFVIELAKTHHIACKEIAITETELRTADEVWVTSSTKEIYPIVKLDDKAVANGKPGEVWQRMHQYYRQSIINLINQK